MASIASNINKIKTGSVVPKTTPTPGVPVAAVKATITPVSATASKLAPQMTTAQNTFMQKGFGGTDKYIQDQLNRFNTADSATQGKLTTDLARFGVKPPTPVTPSTVSGSVNTTLGAPSAGSLQWAQDQSYKSGKTTEGFDTYLRGAGSQQAINQVAGLHDQQNIIQNQIKQLTDSEVAKGHGLTDDWIKANLAPLYDQYYGLEDQMNQLGVNGQSDNFTLTGINRDATGHSATQSAEAFNYAKQLMQQGMDSQTAFETANKAYPTSPVSVPGATNNSAVAGSVNQYTSGGTPVQAPGDYFSRQFGGMDKYATDQNKRYADAIAQGKTDLVKALEADAKRVGYALNNPLTGAGTGAGGAGGATQGGTTGSHLRTINGVLNIVYPDGHTDPVDTSAEQEIANQLGTLEGQQSSAQAEFNRATGQNQADYTQGLNALTSAEAVDKQGAQELQNRRGGFYSGGLDYQLGGINSAYASERGQLAQNLQRSNEELSAKYGAQTTQITNQIAGLLQSAPGFIQQAIDEAKAKKDAQALEVAKTTGIYTSTDAQDALNQLLSLKQQAEAPGITAQARAGLSQQADVLRSRLANMGVDISKLGANTALKTASTQSAGVKTEERRQAEAAEAEDIAKREEDTRQFNETQAYNKAQNTIKNEQWRKEFVEDQRQYDLGYALDKLKEKNQKAYQDATLAIQEDDNALQWYKEDYDQQYGGSSSEKPTFTPAQVTASVRKNYTVTDPTTNRSRITADPKKREQMFLEVIDSTDGMTDTQIDNILRSLGMTKQEISAYEANYGGK